MDLSDTINLAVSVLLVAWVVARRPFWKQTKQPADRGVSFGDILLLVIAMLSLSVVHHWNAPHRHIYQYILAGSAFIVSTWKLAVSLHGEWQASKQRQTRKIDR
jgi:hypothetical protein